MLFQVSTNYAWFFLYCGLLFSVIVNWLFYVVSGKLFVKIKTILDSIYATHLLIYTMQQHSSTTIAAILDDLVYKIAYKWIDCIYVHVQNFPSSLCIFPEIYWNST